MDSIADGKTDRALDLIKRHIRYLWNRIPQDFWDRIPRESEGEEQGRHPGPNEWNGDWDVEGVVANILSGSPGPSGGNPREQRNLGRK